MDKEVDGKDSQRISVWKFCLISGILSVLAFPPYEFWPLAFVAPIGWCLLIEKADYEKKISYFGIWLFGLLQWGTVFHFLRIPHWAGWFGIPLMGGYFSLFVLLFVMISRSLRHRWRIPVAIAAPVTWCGLEAVRSTFLTGFPIALWGHTLYRQTFWIQIADIAGEITVSFFLILVASLLTSIVWTVYKKDQDASNILVYGLALVGVLSAIWSYSSWSMDHYSHSNFTENSSKPDSESQEKAKREGESQVAAGSAERPTKVLLLQGTRNVRFGLSSDEYEKEEKFHYKEHRDLIINARKKHKDIAVVVWPESMFSGEDFLPGKKEQFDPRLVKIGLTEQSLAEIREGFQLRSLHVAGVGEFFEDGVPQIHGCRSTDPSNFHVYNAGVYVDHKGAAIARYFKTHLVPFGEYLPLGEVFPFFYNLAPMDSSLAVGNGAVIFEVEDKKILPVICFESMIGNFVRGYFTETAKKNSGESADALVTLTNDGWYWGSSALDLHLAANVFRAVENRTTHLVAANTGLSAEISPTGQILQSIPRRTAGSLVCKIHKRNKGWQPLWWSVGIIPWFVMMTTVFGLYLAGRFGLGKSSVEENHE